MSNGFRPPGEGGGRESVLLGGSPFATFADLETYAQANPSDLLNSTTQVAVAVVNADGANNGNYQWAGPNQVYAANSWLFMQDAITQEEKDFLTSALNLSPNTLPVVSSGGGTLEDSIGTQENGDTIAIDGTSRAAVNTFRLGLVHRIDSAGYNVRLKNDGSGESFGIMRSNFAPERHPGLVRVRNGNPLDNNNDFQLPINLVDTDILTNPEYSLIVPSITDEQGQTATTALVKIDPTSVLTNFVLEFSINGDLYVVFKEATLTSGDYVFTYEPEIDIPVGSLLTVKITSPDGDVKLLGDSVSGIPYLIQNVQQYNDKRIYHLEDEVPTYKNANTPANQLFINDAETIAADTDAAGAFTLSVDVNEVDWFNVFDFSGRWNFGSRRLTIALSNGDNYFLTRRNRKYFFYKDEQGVWQWYYTPHFLG